MKLTDPLGIIWLAGIAIGMVLLCVLFVAALYIKEWIGC